MISIITPTYNCETEITQLINSLKLQSDKNFEWIIVDNLSTDKTIEKIINCGLKNIKILEEKDHGIFDAINKGIKKTTCQYYLFMGADDKISSETVKIYNDLIFNENYDIISSNFVFKKKVYSIRKFNFFHPYKKFITGHPSTLIKKDIHLKLGYYSSWYPIAADIDFFMKIYSNRKKIKIKHIDFVSLEFGDGGGSTIHHLDSLVDQFKIHCKYYNKIMAFIYFALRFIYHYRKI